jgi:hypothetical protein
MSWTSWTVACLLAALLGVGMGAMYVAATDRFDAAHPVATHPSATSALPPPAEQVSRRPPLDRFAPAGTPSVRTRAGTSDHAISRTAHPSGKAKQVKHGTAKAPKAGKAKRAEVAQAKHEKSSAKRGQAKKGR